MNRIKYEQYHGAAGYDAVARKKIKELEKNAGGGLDMVIQCSAEVGNITEDSTFTVLSGDFESLKAILQDGAVRRANVMLYMPWVYGDMMVHEQYAPCNMHYINDPGHHDTPEIIYITFDLSKGAYLKNDYGAYLVVGITPGNVVTHFTSIENYPL